MTRFLPPPFLGARKSLRTMIREEIAAAEARREAATRTCSPDGPWRYAANWKSWDGSSPAPVSDMTEVAILLRNGDVDKGRAGQWCWTYGFDPTGFQEPDDIVAYRVRPAAAEHAAQLSRGRRSGRSK